MREFLEALIQRLLKRAAAHRALAPVIGLLAYAQTVFMALPVTVTVAVAVLIAPRQLRAVVWMAALGSGLGATTLVWLFHTWGWPQVQAAFPAVFASSAGQQMVSWLVEWGLPGLLGVAVLPVPQAPTLAVFALGQPSLPIVFVLMVVGKLVKYGLTALLVRHFPERFARFVLRRQTARQQPRP